MLAPCELERAVSCSRSTEAQWHRVEPLSRTVCPMVTKRHLKPAGSSTTVTWAMRGRYPFMAKLIGVFMNFDRLVGKDFETGLASLKRATEK